MVNSYFILQTLSSVMLLKRSAAAQESVLPDLRISFKEQECQNGFFGSGLNSTHDSTQWKCFPDLGVQILSGSQVLLRSIPLEGYQDIEMGVWFQPSPDGDASTILTISGPSNEGLNICDKRGVNLLLVQEGSVLVMHYRANGFCRRRDLMLNQTLTHLAVSLEDGKQEWALNGVSMETSEDDLTLWNSSKLNIYGGKAILYQVSLFGVRHSPIMLNDLLPMTSPIVCPERLIINEDAEVGVHEASWYHSPPLPLESQRIPILDCSLTAQQFALLRAQGYPIEHNRSISTYLTRPPTKGALYSGDELIYQSSDTTEDGLGRIQPILIPSPQELVYLPPYNSHSENSENGLKVFGSFGLCLSQNLVVHYTQCRSTDIQIVVRPVNDPPMALTPSKVMMKEGDQSMIRLAGIDVDIYDKIRQVEITRHPSGGLLQLHVGSFRVDGILDGSNVTGLIQIDNGLAGEVYVKYIWNPRVGLNQIVMGDTPTADSFAFRVSDNQGSWSDIKTVQIRVASSLEGRSSDLTIIEDGTAEIVWSPYDGSGYNRVMGYMIETLPAEQEGVLVEISSGERVKVGSFFRTRDIHSHNNVTVVKFISAHDFCSDHPVEFQFRVVAFADDENNDITSISKAFTQRIKIECREDPIELVVKEKNYSLVQATLCSLTNGCLFDDISETITRIDSIELKTIDYGRTLEALVTVVSDDNTFASIGNSKNITLVAGRKDVSQNGIVFMAPPREVGEILSDLEYQSLISGIQFLNVSVQYGSSCGSNKADLSCQTVSYSIPIQVRAAGNVSFLRIDRIYDVNSMIAIFVGLIIIPALGAALAWREAYQDRQQQGSETDTVGENCQVPDGFDDEEQEPEWIEITTGPYPYFVHVSDYNTPDPPKTYRAPRDAVVMYDSEFRDRVSKGEFPGTHLEEEPLPPSSPPTPVDLHFEGEL